MDNKYQKGVSRNVILLGLVSFLNDLSSEMIIPILPMFIMALGGTGFIVGLIGGLQTSISSILKVLFGYWSDRIGRRKIFVFYGYLTSASFKLLLSFSTLWQHILVLTSFERIGKGMRTAPRDVIIADSMPVARSKGFGIHRAFDTAGAISGGIAAFIFLYVFGLCFSSIIFIAAIVAFFCLIPLYRVKEKRREPQEIGLRIRLRELPKSFNSFMIVVTIFAFSNFTYMFFILKAMEVFTPIMPVKESTAIVVLLYVLSNFFYAVLVIPFGTLSDRIGRRKVLIFGYLLFSVVCIGFAFADSLTAFLILFPLYRIVYAMVDGNQRAFVSDMSTGNSRATALGTFHTLIGIIALPSSLIAGYLWTITPAFPFLFASLLSIIAVILFAVLSFRD